MFTIETSRLLLRELNPDDSQLFFQLNEDPEVMKYTGDLPFEDEQEARAFLENYSEYQKHGYGRWAVIVKSSEEFAGWCGLKRNEEEEIDLGFRFFRSQWGKGYATESAKACIQYGFEHLDLESIIGRTAEKNHASIRVLEKAGMTYWKAGPCMGISNARYFRIFKSDYLQGR